MDRSGPGNTHNITDSTYLYHVTTLIYIDRIGLDSRHADGEVGGLHRQDGTLGQAGSHERD